MKLAVMGASGRMGQMLVQTILATDGVELGGATERSGSDWVGRDVGEAMGGAALGVSVVDDPLPIFADVDGVIDFTTPDATCAHAELAAQARIVHVIGTTGFGEAHLEKLRMAGHHATIVRAGNMSLGVNLLTVLVKQVAKALDEDFDVEILEMHHNQKVDAPSGTALMLGEAAAEGRGIDLQTHADRVRDGITGVREKGHIGFANLRGGTVVGEHSAIFAGPDERIVLSHIAGDRHLFARGAVKAAIWGRGKAPGEYSMLDVLGLDQN